MAGAFARAQFDSVARGAPLVHGHAGAESRPGRLRRIDAGEDTFLDAEKSGILLIDGGVAGRETILGKSPSHFLRIGRLDSESVPPRALQHPGDDGSVRRSDLEQSAAFEEIGAADPLAEFVPKFVGALEQRNVIGMLKVGLADDARLAVRAAVAMRGRMLIEPGHPQSARGQLPQHRAADPAGAQYDHIRPVMHDLNVEDFAAAASAKRFSP